MARVKKNAKTVLSIHTRSQLANPRKQTAKRATKPGPLDSPRPTLTVRVAFASEAPFTRQQTAAVFRVRSALTVPPKMDSHWLSSLLYQAIGEQAAAKLSFRRAAQDIAD